MDKAYAIQLDQQDPLNSYRKLFRIPSDKGKEKIYFLGNSLGLQPHATKDRINKILDEWSQLGVEGFFEGSEPWMNIHDELANGLSPIVGAKPSEIVVMNSLTVNLHLMMVSFYKPSGKRRKIICEKKAFPSDQYMLETFLKYHGLNPDEIIIEVGPADNEETIRHEEILKAIEVHKDELALVFWGGVNYYTGQVFDIAGITEAAHKAGAVVGFDLAHGAGNISLKLHDWNVDFACWCNYKYLNGGPGAVGASFIHERYHADKSIQRFGGWWGHDKSSRFKMEKGFVPIDSAEGWQQSTPPILLYATLAASLEIFNQAEFENCLVKASLMSSYLHQELKALSSQINILTPSNDHEHGCQVSMLMREKGKEVFKALTDNGIFADWREPNVIRVAPVPLYNSFEEIHEFVSVMKQTLQSI
ncbi:MAG: kynureninase [Flavitalea sp.]